MKAVILTRVSSKEQKDGHSLDAQLRNLERYAKSKKLNVIRNFTLVESSTKTRRPEFNAMITFIKKQHTKIALIVDTVDRLQRSFRETPIFNELMQRDILELHFVKEGNVLTKDANSSQKLMWNMGVVMSQSYTDQLSDNVKRSIHYKIKNGEWCGKAPFGYLNVVDPTTTKNSLALRSESTDIIRRVFEEYATDHHSINSLADKAYEWGLRSRNGSKVCNQLIHYMLQNPFYYGVMRVKGKLYPHNYETIISKETFNRCQEIRNKRSRCRTVTDSKASYLFSGLIKCAVSGRQVSCDLKKGKYIYLISRASDNPSKKLWIREHKVMEQLKKRLQELYITDDRRDSVIKHINDTNASQRKKQKEIVYNARNKLNEIEEQVDKPTDLLISDKVTQGAYERKHSSLQSIHTETTVFLETLSTDDFKEFDQAFITMIRLLNAIPLVIKSSKTALKRALLKTLFSNFYLNDCKLSCTLVTPLPIMLRIDEERKWLWA